MLRKREKKHTRKIISIKKTKVWWHWEIKVTKCPSFSPFIVCLRADFSWNLAGARWRILDVSYFYLPSHGLPRWGPGFCADI